MAENRVRKRLYSDKEIGRLIQRASQIQREASESSERGLSVEEIEHIAAEIGIESGHLRMAIAEMERGPDGDDGFSFWGGPFVLNQERVVEGTLTEEQWERIVQGLRRLTGSTGTSSEIGKIREWKRATKDLDMVLEQTLVTIQPGEDQTTINVQERYGGGAGVAYILSAVVSGGIAGIFLDGGGLSDLVSALILGSSGMGGLVVARMSITYWAKRQRKKLHGLTDWLHESLSQPVALKVRVPGAMAADVQRTIELSESKGEEESRQDEAYKQGLRT